VNPEVLKNAFQFRLKEPDVEALASEAARKWRNVELEITYADGRRQGGAPDDAGLVAIVSPDTAQPITAVRVLRRGPHVCPADFHVGVSAPLKPTPGQAVNVPIHARARMSIYPAAANLRDDTDKKLSALRDAGVDDVSLLDGIDTKQTIAQRKPVTSKLSPAFSAQQNEEYRDRVVKACHAHHLQILAGVFLDEPVVGTGQTDAFIDLIDGDEQRIREFAANVANFVDDFDFDGVAFDVEIPRLAAVAKKAARRGRIELLFGGIAQKLAPKNKIVTYANVPFLRDGVAISKETAHLEVFPYALARKAPNLIARPMAYVGAETWKKTIACALGPVEAASPGALSPTAGLHPGQLQLIVKLHVSTRTSIDSNADQADGTVTGHTDLLARCDQILRRNRVGLICFAWFPTDSKNIKLYTEAVSPEEAQARTRGRPLQVPRLIEQP